MLGLRIRLSRQNVVLYRSCFIDPVTNSASTTRSGFLRSRLSRRQACRTHLTLSGTTVSKTKPGVWSTLDQSEGDENDGQLKETEHVGHISKTGHHLLHKDREIASQPLDRNNIKSTRVREDDKSTKEILPVVSDSDDVDHDLTPANRGTYMELKPSDRGSNPPLRGEVRPISSVIRHVSVRRRSRWRTQPLSAGNPFWKGKGFSIPHSVIRRDYLQTRSRWRGNAYSAKMPSLKGRHVPQQERTGWRTRPIFNKSGAFYVLHMARVQRYFVTLHYGTICQTPLRALRILERSMRRDLNRGCLPSSIFSAVLSRFCSISLHRRHEVLPAVMSWINRCVQLYVKIYHLRDLEVHLSQHLLVFLIKECESKQLDTLLQLLQVNEAYIATNTKLQILARYITLGEWKTAMELIQSIPAPHLSMKQLQSSCVRLLRTKVPIENLYKLRVAILSRMLEMGIRPHRQMSNIIILNAMEVGDRATAWNVHHLTKENGLAPNAHTYAILLKAVQHGEDPSIINSIYQITKKEGIFDPHLGFEFLYAIHVTSQSDFRNNAYTALLPMYQELFDTRCLQNLGLEVTTQSSGKVDPPKQALDLMIMAWLDQYHYHGPVLEVYWKYLHHLRSGHPIIAKLAETSHVSNAFVNAFGRKPRSLHYCTTVIQNMMKPHIDKNAHVTAAKPDVQTWSILLHAYLRNGQHAAADKVLRIMKTKNIKPDQVTFNTLIFGYARTQYIAKAAEYSRLMEEEGFNADTWTFRALGQIKDRKALLDLLRRGHESGDT